MTQKLLLILTCIFLTACPTQDEHPSTPKTYASSEQGIKEIHEDIMALINDTSCSQSTDCGLAALGAIPCGGPASYVAFAKPNVNLELLSELTDKYQSLQKQFNTDNQMVGICQMTPKPSVACQQGQCVTQKESLQIL